MGHLNELSEHSKTLFYLDLTEIYCHSHSTAGLKFHSTHRSIIMASLNLELVHNFTKDCLQMFVFKEKVNLQNVVIVELYNGPVLNAK